MLKIIKNGYAWEWVRFVSLVFKNLAQKAAKYTACNMCKKKETYIGNTVGDNIVGFKSRMNQHISDSRTEDSRFKFPIHVYKYGLKNKCLNELFFEINVMMTMKSSNQFETYENCFHKKRYDTLNCPEDLKK